MRRLAVLAVAAVALLARAEVPRELRTFAEGCVVTVAPGCDSTTLGQLAPGDCVLSTGQYQDVVEFHATAGQEFAVTVRPLASTYTNPMLVLGPPPGDASNTPAVLGGDFGALWFRATSTGNWRVGVGSIDLSARGAYALHIDCVPDEAPGQPPGCIIQDLACNQIGAWDLDASSCKFDDGDPYNQWAFWGVAGDVLRLDMRSTGFAPLFGVYNEEKLLKSSVNDGSRGAVLTYTIPATGWYWVLTTNRDGNTGGSYQLEMTCASSGCLHPYFTAPIADMTVPDGGALLTPQLDFYGGEPLKLQLVDASNAGVYTQSQTTTLQIPALAKSTRVFLRASNECGSTNSNVFTIRPEGTRRRVVRH